MAGAGDVDGDGYGDGHDRRGRIVPSGVYFYVMKVGGAVLAREKLIVIR